MRIKNILKKYDFFQDLPLQIIIIVLIHIYRITINIIILNNYIIY